MIHALILVSRQGKVRLTKWWTTKSMKVRPHPRAPAPSSSSSSDCLGAGPALRDVKVAPPRRQGLRPRPGHSRGRLQARWVRDADTEGPPPPPQHPAPTIGATQRQERAKIVRETTALVLQRQGKLCNFIEWKDLKIMYKRYASLYFCCLTDAADNELMTLESIHLFVQCLDRYFGNVCELDLVFNFHKAYFILDEVFLGGQVQETSKKAVEHFIIAQDTIVEQEKMGDIPTGG